MTENPMQMAEFRASDGKSVRLYRWLPGDQPRATIQIAHGMGEHAGRYDELGTRLAQAGYVVYANDQRGHGATAEPGLTGWMGPDGWNRAIEDAREIAERIAAHYPGVPRVFLGHSMGSMLAQQYLQRHGRDLAAAVFSGTPGFTGWFRGWLSLTLARIERRRLGPTAESPLMQKLIFGNANKAFDGPGASGYEWLSRDAERVAAYAADPLCGFVLRAGSLCDLFAGAREAKRPDAIAGIPSDLPLLVISGSADPVHDGERNLQRMLRKYQGHLDRIDYRLYPDARHELFNETNREQVFQELLAWLDGVLGSARRG
jgi:alpha-beta hydrolase superfamily lysophospholipase